jgi:hypothetical protein
MNKTLKRVMFGAGLLATAGVAMADGTGVDVSGAVQTITGAIVTISAIGVAGLSVAVAVKIFKWVRAAI